LLAHSTAAGAPLATQAEVEHEVVELRQRNSELEAMLHEAQGTVSILRHAAASVLHQGNVSADNGTENGEAHSFYSAARTNATAAASARPPPTHDEVVKQLQQRIVTLSYELVEYNENCSQMRRRLAHMGRELLVRRRRRS
jgi:hypothetical protein